jgi:receptor protein-tyrosine kinase
VIAYDRGRAAFENSVHYLCRSLLLGRIDHNFRVLAVTSSVPGEGKTNLAVSIAASMARCLHERVLLVDTDLRKPHAHQLFDLELNLGLADVLSGKCTLEEAIVATGVDDVWLLSAGQVDLHPHSLLRPADFEQLLAEIRRRYPLTVLDTPPALAVGEALTVCKQADGVLLCAMRDVTRRSQIVRACERLRLARILPMGIVFSGVDSQSYEVRNGTYYYDQSSAGTA